MSNRHEIEDLLRTLYPTPEPQQNTQSGMTRRSFFRLTGAASGGLLLAMSLPGCSKPSDKEKAENAPVQAKQGPEQASPELVSKEPFEPNAWVRIEPDNTATITISKSEMGQGVRTTLALIVAEELDLDWSKVRVTQAPLDAKYGSQGTGGSASVRTLWTKLREAGAAGRAMLVAAAAQALGVDAASLTTEGSHVVHAQTGRKLAYGALADLAAKQTAPASVTLKDPKSFRLLGKEHVGIDVKDIIQGKATYGIDMKREGMLYASIERSPTHGGTVKSFKADKALAMPGVKKVVEIKPIANDVHVRAGVAVIASNTWAAMQGRKALEIQWNPGPNAKETSAGHSAAMHKLTAAKGKEEVNRIGDPDAVLAKAKEVVKARYEVPFIAHATMEPMNCIAHVQGDRCQVWGGIQIPDWAAKATAGALGIPVENVTVNITLLGGGFGRRLNPDFVAEAALVAKNVDVPVQVVWTREDDMRNDFYRPPAVHVIEASLGQDGYPEAWRHRMSTPAIRATLDATKTTGHGLQESNGASDMLYRVPNRSCEYSLLSSGVTRGWWRAVHTTHTSFAVESFIDELAEKAGKDPYEYRMHLIDVLTVDKPEQNKEFPFDPARLKGVLKLAAEKAGWGKALPPGHGMGIACAIDHLSYAAQVIEASVIDGKLRVHKVVCAADCGPVLNPSSARAQLEGGIIQGLSATLGEKITINGGRVEQGNFDSYPILRIGGAPVDIEIHFAQTDAHPTGLGEPSVPSVAPALASAIYKATGKRSRTLPITV